MIRKLLFLASLLSLSALGFGQGVAVPPSTAFKVVNGITQPFSGATITVCAANTSGIPCSPVLTGALFFDTGLTQPKPNPFQADSNGNYAFAIAPGTYTITITGTGFAGYSYQMTSPGTSSGGGGGGGGSTNVFASGAVLGPLTFATLPASAANGTVAIVSDGSAGPACSAGGAGAIAYRVAGAWTCDSPISGYVGAFTVATLPTASSHINQLVRVTDGATSGDCIAGGGSSTALCISNGAAWVPASAGSGSPSFSTLTPGTNNSGPMTVGAGGSMATSGTGSIQATGLPSSTVALLPTNLPTNTLYEVTDGLTTGDCTSGGGGQQSLCRWNGGGWVPIGDGGGVSTLPGTVNLGLSYNMSCATVYGTGAQTTTSGTVTSGSTSVLLTSATGFAIGQSVFIVGAGAASGPYNGLITNVAGSTLTVSPATGTTVTGAAVYNYSAPAQTTTSGLVNSASTVIPVVSVATFFANQGILIAGAGAAGGNYIGTVQGINTGGNTITVTPATSTSVTNAVVEHDESAALNAAITALAGGQVNGTLYTPAGICLFNGPLLRTGDANAVVPIPNVPYNPAPGNFTGVNGPTLSITIQGATVPSWTNYNLQNWTSIPTAVGTVFQTSLGAGNLIGAKNPNETDNFTAVHLTLRNLVFRAPDNPAITMVNCLFCIGLNIQDALFDTMTNGARAFPSQPTNSNGQAFIQPTNANDAQTQLNNIRAQGWFTATNWTEHTDANHIIFYANWQAILCNVPTSGALIHRNWAGYVDLENNAYGIVGTNTCYVNIAALDTEQNLVPSWVSSATNGAMIYDPNSQLTGYVGVQQRNWFSRYGGQNLQVAYIDKAPNASGNRTWVPGFVDPVSSLISTNVFMPVTVSAICDRQAMEINLPLSPTGPVGSGCVTTGFNFTGTTVSVRVPNVLQSNANQYTLLQISDGSVNDLLQVYVNQATINFKKRIGGSFTTIATGTYNPSTMLWWQLSESSGAVTFSTSPDGINWTTFGTCAATCVSWPYSSQATLGVEAACLSACPTYPGYAKFDNFSINLAAPSYPRQIVTDGLFGSSAFKEASACETAFATTTLSTVSTTTNTGLNCLPANAVIDAVVYRITTTITTAASFTIGDGTTAARFCSTQSTLTSGTTGICFVQADQTGAAGPRQTAAAAVRVTANVNPGAGAIRLIVYYHTWTAPTS